MPQDIVRITLRIPKAVHADASDLAAAEDRSLNWFLVHLLRLGLESAKQAQESKAQKEESN